MNAFEQGLNAKPPFPKGFPTRRSITTASQIAAHLGDGFPERLRCHGSGRLVGLRGHNGKDVGFQHFTGGALRSLSSQVSQLQQTDRQRRQEAKQTFQPIDTLYLALFEMASRFETRCGKEPLSLWAIRVWEEDTPGGEEPLEWIAVFLGDDAEPGTSLGARELV